MKWIQFVIVKIALVRVNAICNKTKSKKQEIPLPSIFLPYFYFFFLHTKDPCPPQYEKHYSRNHLLVNLHLFGSWKCLFKVSCSQLFSLPRMEETGKAEKQSRKDAGEVEQGTNSFYYQPCDVTMRPLIHQMTSTYEKKIPLLDPYPRSTFRICDSCNSTLHKSKAGLKQAVFSKSQFRTGKRCIRRNGRH